MIKYSLKKIAEIVNGTLYGDERVLVNGVAVDSRIINDKGLFAPIVGERVDGHTFVKGLLKEKASASLWQKDNPNEMPEGNIIVVEDVLKAIQQLAKAYRQDLTCKIIGVTGSSGKTSTKDIIAGALSGKYKTYKTKGNQNNEIGVPLMLLNIDDQAQYGIIEMGISDFGEMDNLADIVRPDMTIISSIGPAHLNQFKKLENTVKEKCQINKYLFDGQAFYNCETFGLHEYINKMGLKNKPISYGINEGDYHCDSYQTAIDGRNFVCQNEEYHINLIGTHQVLNAIGAIAICKHEGMNHDEIQKGLESVKLTEHRLQLIAEKQAMIIDDTYNANPSSMVASLKALLDYPKDKKIVVLGDMLELGENSKQLHGSVALEIDFSKFTAIYLIGTEMIGLKQQLDSQNIKCYYQVDRQGIVEELRKYLDQDCALFFKASNSMNFVALIDQLRR